MRARSAEALVTGMPWSWAAGVKCVHMIPFAEAPQIANSPASIQNGPVPALSRSTRTARTAAFSAGAGFGTTAVAP